MRVGLLLSLNEHVVDGGGDDPRRDYVGGRLALGKLLLNAFWITLDVYILDAVPVSDAAPVDDSVDDSKRVCERLAVRCADDAHRDGLGRPVGIELAIIFSVGDPVRDALQVDLALGLRLFLGGSDNQLCLALGRKIFERLRIDFTE